MYEATAVAFSWWCIKLVVTNCYVDRIRSGQTYLCIHTYTYICTSSCIISLSPRYTCVCVCVYVLTSYRKSLLGKINGLTTTEGQVRCVFVVVLFFFYTHFWFLNFFFPTRRLHEPERGEYKRRGVIDEGWETLRIFR